MAYSSSICSTAAGQQDQGEALLKELKEDDEHAYELLNSVPRSELAACFLPAGVYNYGVRTSNWIVHSSKGSAESTADYGGSEEQLHFHPLVKDAGVLNLGCYRNTKRRGCRGLVKLTSPVELTMLRAVLSSIVTM